MDARNEGGFTALTIPSASCDFALRRASRGLTHTRAHDTDVRELREALETAQAALKERRRENERLGRELDEARARATAAEERLRQAELARSEPAGAPEVLATLSTQLKESEARERWLEKELEARARNSDASTVRPLAGVELGGGAAATGAPLVPRRRAVPVGPLVFGGFLLAVLHGAGYPLSPAAVVIVLAMACVPWLLLPER